MVICIAGTSCPAALCNHQFATGGVSAQCKPCCAAIFHARISAQKPFNGKRTFLYQLFIVLFASHTT